MDINKYLNLVPTENSQNPKFMAFLESILNHTIGLGMTNESFMDAFDITNAAGKQLDIIGELVGVSRLLPFVPLLGTREMTDDEYRVFIFMKIFRNEWDGTMESAVNIYQSAFQNVVRIEFYDDDSCHVLINIYAQGDTRIAEILNSTGTMLIPAGVGKTVNVVDNEVVIQFRVEVAVTGCVTKESPVTIDDESFLVRDIEDMYVSDLEWRYVRRLEK